MMAANTFTKCMLMESVSLNIEKHMLHRGIPNVLHLCIGVQDGPKRSYAWNQARSWTRRVRRKGEPEEAGNAGDAGHWVQPRPTSHLNPFDNHHLPSGYLPSMPVGWYRELKVVMEANF
ncbi:uncharacterized protein BDZ99DRAFT_177398 [Mytilinidion resinicola]|uniref:Uncharacterized protein n=1 Tax=Mytilinidion resinicola TaxID=574789 RepID=A0A6A6Y321_9PEZI|nr:uncharacterized protein BDZ99DRAFT_177398 [Mytilinidion resinicola]KAF2802923.1 hypothetical protein BDZ99DRAFT_177398 [Mytilinidion resinicola]